MESTNQAASSPELPQNELQASLQCGTATTSLRRSARLRNKAISPQRSIKRGAATSLNQSSTRRKKTNQRRTAGASSSALPDDMLVEILSRLPPKPFFRCKTISKSLLALSSVAFPLNKRVQPRVCGLFHDTISRWRAFGVRFAKVSPEATHEVDLRLSMLPRHDNSRIVDCCNGLLLVKAWDMFMESHLYVCNPATHSVIAGWSLPLPTKGWSFYEVYSLAFDPRLNSMFHIVCFRGWIKQEVNINFFQTFSSKTGKWRSAKRLGNDYRICTSNSGIFVGGRMYRLATPNKLVSVDPSKNLSEVIELPDIPGHSRSQIAQSRGHLNFIVVVSSTLKVWILDSRQEWVLKYQLMFNEVFGAPLYEFLWYEFLFSAVSFENPVALHPEEDVLFVPSANGKLMSFDMNTRKQEEVCNLPRNSLLDFWVYMPCYSVRFDRE